MALPDEFLYQLKSANSIDAIIGSYVNLIRSGRDYVCLCPFHSEKSPSFHIYTDTQSFYCFGCGAGGDVITFIKRIENIDYIESVKLLAQRAGLELPDNSQNSRLASIKSRILEINRATANYYYKQLINEKDKKGLQYFASRKLKPETIKKYGLGYAPSSWNGLQKYLLSQGFSNEEMLIAGVRSKSRNSQNEYDTFRGRVIFPIIDLRGNVIAFGGRILEGDGPKYLNTGDTPVFKKSRNLFSLNYAKNYSRKQLILAEGYMDVISINQAGFENVVATLGTALTPDQARLMSQYANEVIIAYDSDSAGQQATAKAINLFSEVGINTRIIKMTDAKDPDEFIKKFGSARFRMLLDNSDGAVNFELEKCKNGLDTDTEPGKVEFLKRSVKFLSTITNNLERDVYIYKVAKENEINAEILRSQINFEIRKKSNINKKNQWKAIRSKPFYSDNITPESIKNPKQVKAEEHIIAFMLHSQGNIKKIISMLSEDCFITEFYRKIYKILCANIDFSGSFALSMFSNVCNDEEMGRITGIEAKYKNISMTEKSIDDCINILKDFKANTTINEKNEKNELSNDDLMNIVKKARKNK